MTRTVLVTGAAGLIGSEVCKVLLEKNYKVIATDNFSIGDWKETHPNLQWVAADLVHVNLKEQFSCFDIQYLIHCAAHPGGKSLNEPVLDVEVNALASMKLFKWCAEQKIEVLYLSSSSVYGPSQPNIALKEDAKLDPGTIYAVCKVACENFLKILGDGYGLKWTTLRLFATYGSGHKFNTYQGIVNIILTQILQSDKIVIKGPLARVRGLIYVKDASLAIAQALESQKSRGQVINISHPKPSSIGEIAEILLKLTRKNIPIVVEGGTVGDPFYNYADTSKAFDIIGFKPSYSLEEGLKELVEAKFKDL